MFAHWAQRGYVVAVVHHCDGSSNQVPRRAGNHLLYEHPDMLNYDINYRPNQIERREQELFEMLQFIQSPTDSDTSSDYPIPAAVRDSIDLSQVFVAGFSYGAATAALSVSKHPTTYRACILLDGWFHIDVPSRGASFAFPAAAHQPGALRVPALFIGSEQFAMLPLLAGATTKLHSSCPAGSALHVLDRSKHQNFTDVGFWIPIGVLKAIGMLGGCDYDDAYRRVLELTNAFLKQHKNRH